MPYHLANPQYRLAHKELNYFTIFSTKWESLLSVIAVYNNACACYNAGMNRVQGRIRGFTLVELIVVIAVIGILATITVIGFGRYQADTRDARRASSATVIVESLEKYYDENGEYPGCNAMTATPKNISDNTLKGISPTVLKVPQATASQTNSIKCYLSASPLAPSGTDFFEYEGDGSVDCIGDGSCLKYTFRYKKESNSTIISISSRRNTSIATAKCITDLKASSTSFSTIALSWSNVANATSYQVQQASNSTFTNNLVTMSPSPTTNSYTATGLTAGNTYYYRVQPIGASGTACTSNVASATTRAIQTPFIVSEPISSSQITVTWADVQYETSYTLQYSTTGNWSAVAPEPLPVTVSPNLAANATTYTLTGLTPGIRIYFQLRANGSGDQSDWSNTAYATPTVPAPSCMSASTTSSTAITATWCSVASATSYKLQYSASSTFSSGVTTIENLTSVSRSVTGLTQGAQYYFRAYALVGSAQSGASPTANDTTTISTPSAPSITAYRPGATRATSAGSWIVNPGGSQWYYAYATATGSCPSGTSARYMFRGNYNENAGGTPGPSDPASTATTTTRTWYMIQPTSGYKIKFGARVRCYNSSTATYSSWSGYKYSCAQNSGSTVTCNF